MSELPKNGLYMKRSFIIMYFAMLVVFGAIAAVNLSQGKGPVALFPAVVGGLVGIWAATTPLVRAYGDHVEMKLGPLAPRRKVLYTEFERLEHPSPKKAILHYRAGDQSKTIKIPLSMLAPADAERLVKLLESRAKA